MVSKTEREKVFGYLRQKISDICDIPLEEIESHCDLREDLGMSSLEFISVITTTTQELDIDLMTFSEEDIVGTNLFSDLESLVVCRLGEGALSALDGK